MSQTRKSRSVKATQEGIQKLQQAKAAGRDEDGKPLTYERIAERAKVDKKTVERFFRGEGKDRDSVIAIVQALDLEVTEVVDPKDWNPPIQISDALNWRDICGKVLVNQQEKQLFRRSITGRNFGHEAKNVYVKLGLVKPKEQPQRGEDSQPSAEKGMLQYRLTEKEIEQEYKYDEFLEQVIGKKEKNFAIVGEPGAGKSTWLEQISLYVDNSEKGFPICISLASLGGKTLEEYLLQIWLEDALSFISPNAVEVTSALKNKLKELFNSGEAWLLLDGVDEMRLGGYETPLQTISNQLRGWVDQARVVLTCRLNVWELHPNVLPNFETYRTLHFDDQQVGDFMGQWFTYEGKPELGEKLQNKLGESGSNRIQDLIKNPLRLAMLCGIWYFHQGDLPKTKAALYQQYIDYFYQWKPHPLLTDDLDKQEELHTALSNLALEAIDKRLPLRRKFVHKIIGQSLFQLARDVGWLNLVDKDSETGENVYAFFHLTFQEYFAACAIKDWDYFLPRSHDNNNPKPVSERYRIFEPQWKEVILLWLGREESEDFRKQKEEFIEALVGFEDGCREWFFGYKGFYEYRSYLLAAAGIAEFRECSCADEIVKQLVKWSFGEFNVNYQVTQTFVPHQVAEAAKVTLLDTHHSLAVDALIGFLYTKVDEYTRIKAAEILGKIVPGHPTAIATLLEIMHNSKRGWRPEAVRCLGKIAKGNKEVSTALVDLLHTIGENSDDFVTRVAVASSLSQIEPEHPEAIPVPEYSGLYCSWFQDAVRSGLINPNNPEWIACLVDKIRSSPKDEREEFYRLWAVQHVKASDTTEHEVSTALIDLIRSNPDEQTLQEAVRSLGPIGKSNPEAIDLLIELICKSQKLGIHWQALQSLGYAETSHEKAISVLIELVRTTADGQICIDAAQSLGQILRRYPLMSAVSALKNILFTQIENNSIQNKSNCHRYQKCYDALLNCAQNMTYPDFYQAWHQMTLEQRR